MNDDNKTKDTGHLNYPWMRDRYPGDKTEKERPVNRPGDIAIEPHESDMLNYPWMRTSYPKKKE